MENTIKVSKIPTIGLAVIIAVIGFTFAACGDGGGGGGAGHVHDWGEWVVTKDATCSMPGEKKRTCANDLDGSHPETDEIEIDPNGHDFGESETVTKEATCDENGEGEAEGTCIFCGETTNKILAKLDHDYEYVTIPATCTTEGLETGTCTRNSLHTDSRNIDIDPDAHDYQWTVITPAKYATEGVETETCTYDATHTTRGTRPVDKKPLPVYTITGSGLSFTATKDGENVTGAVNQPIQSVIDAIRTATSDDEDGNECIIQFGNLIDTLNIGTASASFNNTGGTWGLVTLTGKITGSTYSGIIATANAVSITSMADIANTATSSGRAVDHNSAGTFTVSGGTVSATSGDAVYNASTGTVNITGGTVQNTNTSSARAVSNASAGTVNISGGTVSATSGRAISNASTGAVTVSGGTVSVTTGIAVSNDSTGKITVSGTALVTSANTASTIGTIYLSASGTPTAVLLEITGGTIENTSATGTAVRNFSTGAITMSGGTVMVTGTSAVAISNYTTGALTISGGTVSATGASAYAIYKNNASAVVTVTSPPTVIDKAKCNGTITWVE